MMSVNVVDKEHCFLKLDLMQWPQKMLRHLKYLCFMDSFLNG